MRLADHVIGVCSWSLQCETCPRIIESLRALNLSHVQIALAPLLQGGAPMVDETTQLLEKDDIKLTAGMIGFPEEDYSTIASIRQSGGLVPDAKWTQRRGILEQAAKAAHRLRLPMVSTHVGFIPASSDAGYDVLVRRVQEAADLFREYGITLLMETGQETASGLLQFINDIARPNVGVNFDPANMILYGSGNPVDAIRILGRHVKHVHIKDAVHSARPGVIWGEEVPFGKGEVNAMAFIESLRFGGYCGPLMIEREAGDSRVADIHHAISVLASILTPRPAADSE